MVRSLIFSMAVAAISTCSMLDGSTVLGFSTTQYATKLTALAAKPQQDEHSEGMSRRDAFFSVAAAALGVGMANPQPAMATYSAYTRREEDWTKRMEAGEVKITSARNLKKQLQEIAPMNGEGSKIFCPNGPSAAVSPLMENKCGDQMAAPSVFGRQDDIVGNSVPGFKSGYDWTLGGGSSSLSASSGGFPTYVEGELKLKQPRR